MLEKIERLKDKQADLSLDADQMADVALEAIRLAEQLLKENEQLKAEKQVLSNYKFMWDQAKY
ncbi:hypothetical protein L1999_20350 [Neobacillus drentensis]|uniref:hypothetical protein n=1 Tax=Neobacillus drentensis TaxID=220684 RepID=UPI001F35BFC3|nr:hypothetical protein [Neobacillus drentensis]ULT55436.1 hypothetical protein L1999_20350 [Neobacillus drentensis]